MNDDLEMMPESPCPVGGVTERKYAALCLALAMARGALQSAIEGEDIQEVKHILNVTATIRIAAALGCNESELACNWNEHLSWEERERIRTGLP